MTTKIAFSTMALGGKIPKDDTLWPDFTRSFRNLELETIDIANEIYLGHSLTTWHRNNWRHSSNYQLGMHLGLDFDTEDQSSTLAYLAKDRFIAKYASLIYTTPSHTPDAPRARVLFFLDQPIHQPRNYVRAASALLWLFGTADVKCKDPCRFFYGSANCEVEYLDNVLPLEKVKEIIAQWQTMGQAAKRQHEHINTPVDQGEVAQALQAVQPWSIDYNEWLAVLMGIHDAFGDAGLPLAEGWAQGYPGEVAQKWRGFSSGKVGGKVTIATLFKLAKEKGWRKS